MEKTKRQRRFETLALLCERGHTNRRLESLIFKELYPDRVWQELSGEWCAQYPQDSVAYDTAPRYTTSLDAARTAVPRQPCGIEIYHVEDEETGEPVFTVHFASPHGGLNCTGVAPTLELAWLAAALYDQAYLAGPKCPGCVQALAVFRQKAPRAHLCGWCGYDYDSGQQAQLVPAGG